MSGSTLWIYIRANQILVQLADRRVMREEEVPSENWRACLKEIIKKAHVKTISVILEIESAQSEITPLPKVSWYDRYLLKKHIRKNKAQTGRVVLGPHFITRTTTQQDYNVIQEQMLIPIATVSSLSQEVLEFIQAQSVPVAIVRVGILNVARQLIESVPEEYKTDWVCCLYPQGNHMNIAVCLQEHVAVVRNIPMSMQNMAVDKGQLCQELHSTIQYLSRIGYHSGEPVHIISMPDLALTNSEEMDELAQDLGCTVTYSSVEGVDILKGSRSCVCPEIKAHHQAFLCQRVLKMGAWACALWAGVLVGVQTVFCPKVQPVKRYIGDTAYLLPLPKQQFCALRERAQTYNNAIALWQEYVHKSWGEQHMLQALQTIFTTAHPGRFLLSLTCKVNVDEAFKDALTNLPTSSISLCSKWSPSWYYRDTKDPKTKKEQTEFLKQSCTNALETTKQAIGATFLHTRINAKTKAAKKKMILNVELYEQARRGKKKKPKDNKPPVAKKVAKHHAKTQSISYLMDQY